MAKTKMSDARPAIIEIGSSSYSLPKTLEAADAVEGAFGGPRAAMEPVHALNRPSTATIILLAAQGRAPQSKVQALSAELFRLTIAEKGRVATELIDYLLEMSNGFMPLDDEPPADGQGDEGNGSN